MCASPAGLWQSYREAVRDRRELMACKAGLFLPISQHAHHPTSNWLKHEWGPMNWLMNSHSAQAGSGMLLKVAGVIDLGGLLTSSVAGVQLWVPYWTCEQFSEDTKCQMLRSIYAQMAAADLTFGIFFLLCVWHLHQLLRPANGQLG